MIIDRAPSWVIVVLVLLVAGVGCARDATCRHTGTCEPPGPTGLDGGGGGSSAKDAGRDLSDSGAEPSEGGSTSEVEAGSGGVGGCKANDDCESPTPVCGVSGECVACLPGEGCEGAAPQCFQGITEQDNRCVECVEDESCPTDKPKCLENQCSACVPGVEGELGTGCAEMLTCKAGATPPENSCVGCINDDQCQGGICQSQTCIPCDAATGKGCVDPNPKCLAGSAPIVNSCVECLEHLDCGGACQDNLCTECSTVDNTGCSGNSPRCKAGVTASSNSCVECLSDGHCDGGICQDNVCVPCDETTNRGCSAPTPQCSPGATDKQNACVQCLEGSHCSTDGKELCDLDRNRCVGCLANAQCESASQSRCGAAKSCEPCTQDDDCSHITGRNVCDAGECVRCTGTNYDCGMNAGMPLVCDSLNRSCSTEKEKSSGSCQPCVSDAQCRDGRRCVLTEFSGADIGYFCLWKQGDPNGGAPADCPTQGRPYSSGLLGTSIDGEAGTYCKLALSTCPAFNDFRGKSCSPAAPVADECGASGISDGLCRPFGAEHRCTYQCFSGDDCDGSCDTGESPKYCAFDP